MNYNIKNVKNVYRIKAFNFMFDYYSIDPKDINEIIQQDYDMFKIFEKENIFALCLENYDKDVNQKDRLWNYLSLPNNVSQEFKYALTFNKIISEYKEEYIDEDIYFGIAEIDFEFYKNNYSYFNNQQYGNKILILSDNKNIKKIDLELTKIIKNNYSHESDMFEYFHSLPKWYFVDEMYELVNKYDCVLVSLEDDGEHREMNIITKEKENICSYLDNNKYFSLKDLIINN